MTRPHRPRRKRLSLPSVPPEHRDAWVLFELLRRHRWLTAQPHVGSAVHNAIRENA
jgi:hypothetical protein